MFIVGLVIAIIIGLILGLIGGGGSILTIPLAHYFYGISIVDATIYSLFIVAFSSLIGVLKRLKSNEFEFKKALIFVIPSTIIAFVVRLWILPKFPEFLSLGFLEISKENLITMLLITVMMITSYNMLFKKEKKIDKSEERVKVIGLYGAFTGLISGIIGAGGGFIIVPALLKLGISMRKAIGTSMLIICIQSFGGITGDIFNGKLFGGHVDLTLLLTLTILSIFGVLIGSQIQHKFSGQTLRNIFGFTLGFITLVILIEKLV